MDNSNIFLNPYDSSLLVAKLILEELKCIRKDMKYEMNKLSDLVMKQIMQEKSCCKCTISSTSFDNLLQSNDIDRKCNTGAGDDSVSLQSDSLLSDVEGQMLCHISHMPPQTSDHSSSADYRQSDLETEQNSSAESNHPNTNGKVNNEEREKTFEKYKRTRRTKTQSKMQTRRTTSHIPESKCLDKSIRLPAQQKSNSVVNVLQQHIQDVGSQVSADCNDTETKLFVCEHCNKTFNRKSNLVRHASVHNSKEMPFKNEKSKKSQKLKVQHPQHHYKITNDNGNKHFHCGYCGKGFTRYPNLKRHHILHTGDGYRCKVCGKVFTSNYSLGNHMKFHRGKSLHNCTYCGKSFAIVNDYNRHIRIHTGERPFNCETCGRTFSLKGNLKTHMKTHTST